MRHRTASATFLLALISVAIGWAVTGSADAQAFERIAAYDVRIQILSDGALRITETIDYDFGSSDRHGIFRDVPTRLRYDDTYDRVYPLTVESVTGSPGTPVGYEVEEIEGGLTRIKIGDPDVTISGPHRYSIVYRVESALNGFATHDELYWNAVGTEWSAPIGRATVSVEAPAPIREVACFQGYEGSQLSCDRARVDGDHALFGQRELPPAAGVTVVVAIPKGVVPEPSPVLDERWTLGSAFRLTPQTGGAAAGLLALVVGGFGWLAWRTGRDVRFKGSPVDQVMGNPTGEQQAVPLFEADASAPVEFAPPEDLRPGQIGTLVDEQANTLDVSATIVDLAVRGHVLIQEIPKEGWFGKPDWTLIQLEKPLDDLLTYERLLLDALFRDGTEVSMSSLKNTFAPRLKKVEESLYADAAARGWFTGRPDEVRKRWGSRGFKVLLLGGGLTYVLARYTHWGLLGLPMVAAGLLLMAGAKRMPARTTKGTAALRRVRGFRTVIETAETHMARWAEQENVFTRYLPYAIVFGCTDKWARAFEGLASQPDTTWYVSSRPFVYSDFGDTMEGFAVTTGGTIASTPSGSGSSGFGGGGSSGGGGGGGGGGSW